VRLDLVAGPNGSGKSTFIELLLAPARPGVVVVNADVIAADRWPEDPQGRAYDAAGIAARTRARLIERCEPFIAETVFSHPSKLDLLAAAKAAGYTVVLHVLLVPESLAVRRVAFRVVSGGHAVPEEKIRARYRRLWPLLIEAIERADTAYIWGNAGRDGPIQVAAFSAGIPDGSCRWPAWTPVELRRRWAP
jgi:predicted ABC-type ATPase